MTFINAFSGILGLLLIVGLGYILSSMGWFPEPARKLLPRLVNNVTLPPFLACTIITSFNTEHLTHILTGPTLPFLAILILFVVAWITGKIIHVNPRHFGLFCVCFSNPNTIFLGIPINMALYGQEAIQWVLLFYFANTTFFWTIGNYFVFRDSLAKNPQQKRSAYKFQWKKLFSPAILGFLTGLAILLLNIHVPDFLFRSAVLVGDITTPLALIYIGVTLQVTGIRNLHIDRDLAIAISGKLLLSPLVMMLVLSMFTLPELMCKVFIVQSGLPVLTLAAILSGYYETDPTFGSVAVSLSTICCALTIPLIVIFI